MLDFSSASAGACSRPPNRLSGPRRARARCWHDAGMMRGRCGHDAGTMRGRCGHMCPIQPWTELRWPGRDRDRRGTQSATPPPRRRPTGFMRSERSRGGPMRSDAVRGGPRRPDAVRCGPMRPDAVRGGPVCRKVDKTWAAKRLESTFRRSAPETLIQCPGSRAVVDFPALSAGNPTAARNQGRIVAFPAGCGGHSCFDRATHPTCPAPSPGPPWWPAARAGYRRPTPPLPAPAPPHP